MKYDEENKIDITASLDIFLRTVRRFWLLVIVSMVICGMLSFISAWFQYKPQYKCTATFSIDSNSASAAGGIVTMSDQVKETLPYIVKSSYMKHLVMQDLEMNSFNASISVSGNDNVDFFEMTVTADDGQMAYNITESVLKNMPKASVYTIGQVQVGMIGNLEVPTVPSNKNDKFRSLAKGGVVGLAIALAFCALFSFTSQTIQTEDDFKKFLSLKCLATLPVVVFKKRRRKIDTRINIHNDLVGLGYVESFRTIRVRVEREMKKLNAGSILVTSSLAGEGKSTVSTNLAMALAEGEKDAVIIDCDLRNPSVADALGMDERKYKIGIVDVLRKECTLEDAMRYFPDWNLHVIPGTHNRHDPTDVIASGELLKLVNRLKKEFDYVILDTPPAAMLADAATLAEAADCALYVVKQDYARTNQIVEGIEALSIAHTPIIGAVLNGFEKPLGASYGSYRYEKYGYGYGEDGKRKKKTKKKEPVKIQDRNGELVKKPVKPQSIAPVSPKARPVSAKAHGQVKAQSKAKAKPQAQVKAQGQVKMQSQGQAQSQAKPQAQAKVQGQGRPQGQTKVKTTAADNVRKTATKPEK